MYGLRLNLPAATHRRRSTFRWALGSRLQEIPDSVPVVLCCASGTRSALAKLMLKKRGYKQVYTAGKWANLPP